MRAETHWFVMSWTKHESLRLAVMKEEGRFHWTVQCLKNQELCRVA